jgi:hypothetical protein
VRLSTFGIAGSSGGGHYSAASITKASQPKMIAHDASESRKYSRSDMRARTLAAPTDADLTNPNGPVHKADIGSFYRLEGQALDIGTRVANCGSGAGRRQTPAW